MGKSVGSLGSSGRDPTRYLVPSSITLPGYSGQEDDC